MKQSWSATRFVQHKGGFSNVIVGCSLSITEGHSMKQDCSLGNGMI